jgi:hypothetical protein
MLLSEHPCGTRSLAGFADVVRLLVRDGESWFLLPVDGSGNAEPLGEPIDGYRTTTDLHPLADGRMLIVQVFSSEDGDVLDPDHERFMVVGMLDEPDALRRVGPASARNMRRYTVSDDGRWLAFATVEPGDTQNLYLADLSADPIDAVLIAEGNRPGGQGAIAFAQYYLIDTASEALLFVQGWEIMRAPLHQPQERTQLASLPPQGLGGDMQLLPDGRRFVLRARQNWVGSTTVPGALEPLLQPPATDDWLEADFLPFP